MSDKKNELEQNQLKPRQAIADVTVNDLGVRSRGSRRRVSTHYHKPSLTVQADADRANINKILARYKQTGLVPQRTATPYPEDKLLPDVDSFHDAMNKVTAAQQAFANMPSAVRAAFDNNPTKLLAALNDETQHDKLVELGVLHKNDASQASPSGAGEGATPPPAPVAERPQEAGEAKGASPAGGKEGA